jgi:hypothetical protein
MFFCAREDEVTYLVLKGGELVAEVRKEGKVIPVGKEHSVLDVWRSIRMILVLQVPVI